MLPPRQVCSKGNACLTCHKFVTDASHRDELQQSEALIARRQTIRVRSQEAEKRARTALAELFKADSPVSFTAVARQAGVSTDFLYRSPELRAQIERHRAKGGSGPAATANPPGAAPRPPPP